MPLTSAAGPTAADIVRHISLLRRPHRTVFSLAAFGLVLLVYHRDIVIISVSIGVHQEILDLTVGLAHFHVGKDWVGFELGLLAEAHFKLLVVRKNLLDVLHLHWARATCADLLLFCLLFSRVRFLTVERLLLVAIIVEEIWEGRNWGASIFLFSSLLLDKKLLSDWGASSIELVCDWGPSSRLPLVCGAFRLLLPRVASEQRGLLCELIFLAELAHTLYFICRLERVYRDRHRILLKLKHILSLLIVLKAHLSVSLGASLFYAVKRALIVRNGSTAEAS